VQQGTVGTFLWWKDGEFSPGCSTDEGKLGSNGGVIVQALHYGNALPSVEHLNGKMLSKTAPRAMSVGHELCAEV